MEVVQSVKEKTFNWQVDNILRWKKEFGEDHRVEATFLQNAEKGQWWKTVAQNKLYSPSDILGFHNIGAGTAPSVSSEDTYKTGDALMGRLFYSFKDKYMLTASVRRDGYSAFGSMIRMLYFRLLLWVGYSRPKNSWKKLLIG